MYKVLVAGCGNIGAQYDRNTNEIQTHIKAWYQNKLAELSVYDVNTTLSNEVAKQYNCKVLESLDASTMADFDCVCICTPTSTHLALLDMAIAANVNTIICEKPISISIEELEFIKQIYTNGNSKVIVNYIRRFLPAYSTLKTFINSIRDQERLTTINIKYQKGFLNNGSHAFDLIEYLFNEKLILKDYKTHHKIVDFFKEDPTLSLQANWNQANFSIVGLADISFTHFEIELYFEYYKILIKDSGDKIEIYKSEDADGRIQPLILQSEMTKCLKDYMYYVSEYAVNILNKSISEDNFLNSLELNQRMLTYKNN